MKGVMNEKATTIMIVDRSINALAISRPLARSSERRPAADRAAAAILQQRRALLWSATAAAAWWGWGVAAPPPQQAALAAEPLPCRGERGYALSQCLRRARQEREAAEAAAAAAQGGGGGADSGGASTESSGGSSGTSNTSYPGDPDAVQAARLKYRQYEQPGELITLQPSGVQYREIVVGSGPRAAAPGDSLELSYTVYRLSSRATPVYAWSCGTGQGLRDDVGDAVTVRLGDPLAVPAAVAIGLVGMREGGRRRILVPPRLGWAGDGGDAIGPPHPDFTAARRFAAHRREPLLFEAELLRVRPAAASAAANDALLAEEARALEALLQAPGAPFRLPQPRSPYADKLG